MNITEYKLYLNKLGFKNEFLIRFFKKTVCGEKEV